MFKQDDLHFRNGMFFMYDFRGSPIYAVSVDECVKNTIGVHNFATPVFEDGSPLMDSFVLQHPNVVYVLLNSCGVWVPSHVIGYLRHVYDEAMFNHYRKLQNKI